MTMQSDAKNLPTEPGWYFAKNKETQFMCCILVGQDDFGHLFVDYIGCAFTDGLGKYEWFGRVPMPVEID